jgi:hypothetical protein
LDEKDIDPGVVRPRFIGGEDSLLRMVGKLLEQNQVKCRGCAENVVRQVSFSLTIDSAGRVAGYELYPSLDKTPENIKKFYSPTWKLFETILPNWIPEIKNWEPARDTIKLKTLDQYRFIIDILIDRKGNYKTYISDKGGIIRATYKSPLWSKD